MHLKRTSKKNPKTPEVDSNIFSAVFHLEGSLLLTACWVSWLQPAVCSWAQLTPPQDGQPPPSISGTAERLLGHPLPCLPES